MGSNGTRRRHHTVQHLAGEQAVKCLAANSQRHDDLFHLLYVRVMRRVARCYALATRACSSNFREVTEVQGLTREVTLKASARLSNRLVRQMFVEDIERKAELLPRVCVSGKRLVPLYGNILSSYSGTKT